MTDFGIILAAGASRRMGRPKQLLELDGTTLVERAVESVRRAGARPLVILGAHAAEVVEHTGGASTVVNPDWREGMGTSLAHGVENLPASAKKALVVTVDQPDVCHGLLSALLDACDADHDASATRSPGGPLGVPACFRASVFDALATSGGDVGARELLRSGPLRVASVQAATAVQDVDTPEAWQRYRAARSPVSEGTT